MLMLELVQVCQGRTPTPVRLLGVWLWLQLELWPHQDCCPRVGQQAQCQRHSPLPVLLPRVCQRHSPIPVLLLRVYRRHSPMLALALLLVLVKACQ